MLHVIGDSLSERLSTKTDSVLHLVVLNNTNNQDTTHPTSVNRERPPLMTFLDVVSCDIRAKLTSSGNKRFHI